MNYKLLVFMLLVFISYIYEKINVKCRNNKTVLKREIISFLHHIISVYSYFGTLVFNKYYTLHLLTSLCIVSHWSIIEFYNDGCSPCFLQTKYNKLCGLECNKKFQDINQLIGGDDRKLQTMVLLYDFYFISKGCL